MNILIANDTYPTAKTPFAAFLSVLVKEFVRRGHFVTVIAPQSLTKHWLRHSPLNPREYDDVFDIDGREHRVRIYQPYSLTFGAGRFRNLTLMANRWAFNRVFRRVSTSFDVLYAQFWVSAFTMLDAKLSHPEIPLFVDCGEDVIDVHRSMTKQQLMQIRNAVDGVICVSTKCMNESVETQLTVPEKCKVIVNGIEPGIFKPMDSRVLKTKLGIADGDFTIAFVGRFIHRKGVGRIVRALRLLDDSRLRLILIGRSDECEQEDLDYEGIVFCGQVAHDEIPRYLNCADLYVFPTLAEGCSNSLIEAMACGLPIISSDRSFNYDILDSENAVLTDPMDIGQIAQAVQTLRGDSARRSAMSKSSLDKAAELTISNRVEKILDYINLKENKVI